MLMSFPQTSLPFASLTLAQKKGGGPLPPAHIHQLLGGSEGTGIGWISFVTKGRYKVSAGIHTISSTLN